MENWSVISINASSNRFARVSQFKTWEAASPDGEVGGGIQEKAGVSELDMKCKQ
jgi:hypothetical protein